MKVCVLSSGSGGNSTFISSSGSSLIIDAGISCKRILERLRSASCDPGGIGGILVTHDHSDHISGAGTLSRKLKVPVYIHEENWRSCRERFNKCEVHFIKGNFFVGDFFVEPFPVSHDGTLNYGFCVHSEEKKITHLTDTGTVTSVIRQRITGSHIMILESNHDPEMLIKGPYPWYLKQRIAGNLGHLSNKDACKLISESGMTGLKHLILAHLSKENNDPVLAYDLMEETRESSGMDFRICVAPQDTALEPVEI